VYCEADSPSGNINGDTAPNIMLYGYQPSRAGHCAVIFLQDKNKTQYTDYLKVDGYAGYHQSRDQLVVCMAHICRKFDEAKKVQINSSKKNRKGRLGTQPMGKSHSIL
jgi:hypothetical protein